ncbi:MAG: hypothetical protein IJV64_09145, partial [Oscillospiraceae bacterium]|nr:hypothetical protein [Oscillospiraceae bacterium]
DGSPLPRHPKRYGGTEIDLSALFASVLRRAVAVLVENLQLKSAVTALTNSRRNIFVWYPLGFLLRIYLAAVCLMAASEFCS